MTICRNLLCPKDLLRTGACSFPDCENKLPDVNCITAPDGDCVGEDCMHTFRPFPVDLPEALREMESWLRARLLEKCGPSYLLTVDNLRRTLREVYAEACWPYPGYVVERDPDHPYRLTVSFPLPRPEK